MSKIKVITLKDSKGIELQVSNYGAAIISLKIPAKSTKLVNVVVGLSSEQNYLSEPYKSTSLFLGSSVGRYAGRISEGRFTVENKEYPIYQENGVHLHGGKNGFDKKYWTIESANENSVTFSCLSKHLEEGYPGNLQVFVTYELINSNALKITYKAKTDITTIINLTNHSYFNLDGKGTVLDHNLIINSDSYLEVDTQLIPTGKILDANKTRFDFTTVSRIGKENFEGLDDTFILNNHKVKASLSSKKSGIKMNVYTNQPAMVVYTPKQFPNLLFKDKATYSNYPAICFETQNYPDAPHHSHFPSSILKPTEEYLNETIFEFEHI